MKDNASEKTAGKHSRDHDPAETNGGEGTAQRTLTIRTIWLIALAGTLLQILAHAPVGWWPL
ncbi:MAG: hypothetical protein AAFN70_08870, partial [Planctomycetota bacterium]